MTFPQSSLGTEVELYLGSWTDVSSYVYQRDPIQITRGRSDESSQVNPSSCTLTLNDRDARFSINNPMGPYYGQLTRNTPVRVSVPNSLLPAPYNTTYLRMEDDAVSFASCPAATRIELTGSLDIRIDVDITGYQSLILASIWGASASVNQRCWSFGVGSSGYLTFSYTTDGTLATRTILRSGPATPGLNAAVLPVGRMCLRATFDATTGTATFYTAPAGAIDTGPWTQFGPSASIGAPVTLFASTSAALTVGSSAGITFDFGSAAVQGAVYDMELRSGIGGTIVARPAFNAQTAGATSWTDAPGNTWSVSGTATLSNRSYRYHGELSQTPKGADPSATDVYSQATASGILRRLQQAQTPLNSALYRAYVRQSGTSAPTAYWPCEDGEQATQLASGLPGVQAMQISGSAQLASDTSVLSSAALPVVNGSIWRGTVPTGGTWTQSQVELVVAFPSSASSETDQEVIASIYTNGSMARMDLRYGTAGTGSLNLVGYNSAGVPLFSSGALGPAFSTVTGEYLLTNFGLQLVGGVVQWTLSVYAPGTAAPTQLSGTATGAAIAPITSVTVNTFGTCQQLAVGHLGVFPTTTPNLNAPFNAYAGDPAAARIQRLCNEEGIACRIVGHPEMSIQMGPQGIQTLPDLIQECETTDRGMLFEPRTCLGIGYRTAYSMYNQMPKTTAVYNGAQLDAAFASTADDQLTLNDVTVSNADGSSARQVLTSGAMSIQSPPNGVGRVDTSIQVNALSDAYLPGIAQWILNVSTDGHDRFPVIPFNLARTETPMSVATLDVGDMLAVTNPPTWLQPDEIDQLSAGFAETLGPFAVWQINVNSVPAYPYTIATVAPATSAAASFTGAGYAIHADTDGTTLGAALAPTDTLMTFNTVAGFPPWTSNPGDFPFDVNVAGERITVLGPGVTRNPDPLLQQGLATYSADHATIALSSTVGAPYAATGYSMQAILVTPAGAPNTFADVHGPTTGAGVIATSTGYTLWAWVYATATRTYSVFANWYNGSTSVSQSLATGVSVTAGTWTLISGTVTSPPSGINAAQFGVGDFSTPSAAQTFSAWGINGARTSNIMPTSPQTMTGQRAVNGVSKSQASGTPLTLWYRPVVGQLTGA